MSRISLGIFPFQNAETFNLAARVCEIVRFEKNSVVFLKIRLYLAGIVLFFLKYMRFTRQVMTPRFIDFKRNKLIIALQIVFDKFCFLISLDGLLQVLLVFALQILVVGGFEQMLRKVGVGVLNINWVYPQIFFFFVFRLHFLVFHLISDPVKIYFLILNFVFRFLRNNSRHGCLIAAPQFRFH